MLSLDERKKLVGEVSRLAFESMSPEALGRDVMPPLRRLVDASSTLFYRINEQGHLVPLAGTLIDGGYRYSREYYEVDPLQGAMRNENPWVFRTERSPDAWRQYLGGPIYIDLSRRYDVHTYLHIRLVNSDHGAPGTYGIMLAHGERQPEFSPQDELDLIELLPALEAAIRRSAREQGRHGALLALEAAFDRSRPPTIIMDACGGLLWASKRARRLLGLDQGGKPVVPKALREGALQLGRLIAGECSSAPPTISVQLVALDGERVKVDLRTARTDAEVPVIVAELAMARQPRAADLAASFKLTPAQASVLVSLAQGCSDRVIAERHAISVATVRSHIGQILSRLGVESRLQAALLAARCDAASSPDLDDDDCPTNGR